MEKARYTKISEHEKFLSRLLKYVEGQIKGFKYLQKGYTNVTFREVFQTLEYIKKEIEEFSGEEMTEVNLEVSKVQFRAYFTVQNSGVTNMMNVKNVIYAANEMCDVVLTNKDCFYIMRNYAQLLAEYQ